MGFLNDLAKMAGLVSSKKRRSKGARLASMNRKLDKRLAERKLEKQIKSKKRQLGMYVSG
jgi:hypothetical protein